MKHKHYEMIVAKAANTSLIVFCKQATGSKWQEMSQLSHPNFGGTHDYFLCLPQHKEACLYWLNGGAIESLHKDYEPMKLAECGSIEWGVKSTFMKDSIEIRIKPRKEKRWIIIRNGHPVRACFDSNDEAVENSIKEDQIIEIEVEV
jgi:hypothetical protein